MTERQEDTARVGEKVGLLVVAARNMSRRFAIPDIENDPTPSSVGTPLLVFGRERVAPQQHGLVSDFTSVFGPNNTFSTREPTRGTDFANFGAIIAETNDPNISSLQREVEGKQGN